MYCISFIVLLAGFGYCAGNVPKCDARVAAGVSKSNPRPFEEMDRTLKICNFHLLRGYQAFSLLVDLQLIFETFSLGA